VLVNVAFFVFYCCLNDVVCVVLNSFCLLCFYVFIDVVSCCVFFIYGVYVLACSFYVLCVVCLICFHCVCVLLNVLVTICY